MALNISNYPKCYSLSVAGGSTYNGANLTTFPASCYFLQITNEGNYSLNVKLNGDSGAVFPLAANSSQVFNTGDLKLTSVDFASAVSGASAVAVYMIAGLGNY